MQSWNYYLHGCTGKNLHVHVHVPADAGGCVSTSSTVIQCIGTHLTGQQWTHSTEHTDIAYMWTAMHEYIL